jgi:hypothetical protein
VSAECTSSHDRIVEPHFTPWSGRRDLWMVSFSAQGNDVGAWRCQTTPQHSRGQVDALELIFQSPEWAHYRQALKAANTPGAPADGLANMELEMLIGSGVATSANMDGFKEHTLQAADEYERGGKVVLTIDEIAWPSDGAAAAISSPNSLRIDSPSGTTTTDIQCVWATY